ncbi:hypothetical protein [Nocardia sp. bgisy118]|uniref:hypothetical protein n=1 Tax=Nocardia sp. bgisy118 TaxID=3413786 RepID=UPI003F4A423D
MLRLRRIWADAAVVGRERAVLAAGSDGIANGTPGPGNRSVRGGRDTVIAVESASAVRTGSAPTSTRCASELDDTTK